MHDPIRLAVLISGGGTTLQNFMDRVADGRMKAEIALVISNNPAAAGLERARRAGIAAEVIRREDHADTHGFSAAIFARCRAVHADLVTLAGFLKLLEIPADFAGRVMNIHPALIPQFCGKGMYGARVHQAVLESGAKLSGCTVHLVDNEYDHGPIILQRTVPVLEEDTSETLAARVFREECKAYPEAIELFATVALEIEAGRVRVRRKSNSSG